MCLLHMFTVQCTYPLKGEGIDELLAAIEDALPEKNIEAEFLLPFSKSGLAAEIRRDGTVLCEEYVAEGLKIRASVDPRLYGICKEFIIEEI